VLIKQKKLREVFYDIKSYKMIIEEFQLKKCEKMTKIDVF